MELLKRRVSIESLNLKERPNISLPFSAVGARRSLNDHSRFSRDLIFQPIKRLIEAFKQFKRQIKASNKM